MMIKTLLKSLGFGTQPLLLVSLLVLGACSNTSGGGGSALLGSNGGTGSAVITITGPSQTASGALQVDGGGISGTFLVNVIDANGNPVSGDQVTIAPTAAGKPAGTIDSPPTQANTGGGTTDIKGDLQFAYEAPAVTKSTQVTLTASATVFGAPVTATYTVTVVPQQVTLTLTGPGGCGGPNSTTTCVASTGTLTSGFLATLTALSPVSDTSQPVPDNFVSIVPSNPPGGTINAPASQPDTGGNNTNANGQVSFAYQAPNTGSTAVTTTLTGSATLSSGQTVTGTLNVVIEPDVFQFTAPAAFTSIQVGSANAKPLAFEWTTAQAAGAQGVSGNVLLTAIGASGFSSSTAQFIVNGTAQSTVTVPTNANNNGNFAVPVSITDSTGESVTITAQDTSNNTRQATLSLQFIATPTAVSLSAQPLAVQKSPSNGRFSTLTFTVLNQANQPQAGVNVTFTLVTPAGTDANERVFPSGGTTNSQGVATSQYEAGLTAGTATVQACVTGTSLCDERTITVQ